jgi:hypothetical protein
MLAPTGGALQIRSVERLMQMPYVQWSDILTCASMILFKELAVEVAFDGEGYPNECCLTPLALWSTHIPFFSRNH